MGKEILLPKLWIAVNIQHGVRTNRITNLEFTNSPESLIFNENLLVLRYSAELKQQYEET